MTRLASIGFETRDFSECVAAGSSAAASATWADGGSYSLRLASTASSWCQVYGGAALGEFFVAFAYRHVGAANTTAALLSWFAGTTELGSVRLNKTTHTLALYTGTGTLVATSAGALSNVNTKYVIGIHVKIAEALDGGAIEVRVDGADFVSFSGDTQPGADTGATIIYAGTTAINQGPTNYAYYDSLLLNDTAGDAPDNTWPDYCPLIPLFPIGNGNASQFTGSDANQVDNYALVDDSTAGAPDGDTTYVKATAADLIDSYDTTDPTIPDGAVCVSVIVKGQMRKTNAAVDTQGALGVRSGGGDYAPTAVSLPIGYGQMAEKRFTLDPADNQAWTPTKINALELLIKSAGAYA